MRTSRIAPSLRAAALLCSATAAVHAQASQWQAIGIRSAIKIGNNATIIGDVNADGVPDVVCWAEIANQPITDFVLSLSGANGQVLAYSPTPWPGRWIYAVGDVDGDGVPDYGYDYWAGPVPPMWAVGVRSGVDHRQIRQIPFSPYAATWDIVGNIDLDRDSKIDLLCCSDRTGGPYGAVWAFRNNGTLLYQISGDANYGFARSLASFKADYDQDGTTDLIVGLTWAAGAGAEALALMSGRTGQLLRVYPNTLPQTYLADGCASVGDLDGDGLPEIAGGGGGAVQVLSPRTGSRIYALQAPTPTSYLGWRVFGGVDIDQDGVPDIVATSLGSRVFAWSGRDGTLLWQWADYGSDGTSASAAPGDTKNRFPYVAIGRGGYEYNMAYYPNSLGAVLMMRGNSVNSSPYGVPCAGNLTAEPRIGIRPLPSNDRQITVSNAPGGVIAVLVLGFSRQSYGGLSLPMDLGFMGASGCSLQASADVTLPLVTGLGPADRGYAAVGFNGLGAVTPVLLHAQWLVGPSAQPMRLGGVSMGLQWTW